MSQPLKRSSQNGLNKVSGSEVLDTGYDIYDPQDALLDLQNNEHAHKRLERFLRKEMRRLAQVYGDKVRLIYATAWSYLKAADDWIRRTAQDHLDTYQPR